MSKPFSPRELAARVRAVLRRGQGGRNKPAFAAVWRVDEAKRRVDYYGQPLELSRYEYNLLLVLLRRPGQVFSRERLMELAWNDPLASLDRTVDSHIKNVRAKLKVIKPDVDPIITHRGLGYSLKEFP